MTPAVISHFAAEAWYQAK